jgi:hypothetical protein
MLSLQEQIMMTKDSLAENMDAVKRKYEVLIASRRILNVIETV